MGIKINSIKEADDLFNRFGVIQARITKEKAKVKDRIAKIKADGEAAIAADVAEAKALEEALKDFCEDEDNRALFTNPRKRKCEQGSYGLQCSTEVTTEKDFDAEAETKRLGIELCKRTVKADLTLVKDALVAGEDIHGAKLVAKERFKYTLKEA